MTRPPGTAALLLFSGALLACTGPRGAGPLAGRVVCIDPGHGGTAATDSYRVGPGGEREEWMDLRVALMLKDELERRGARVLLTRTADVAVELARRAEIAREGGADLFLSVHHNATADPTYNAPTVYFHGNASENGAGVALARAVAARLDEALFGGRSTPALVSDFAIFPGRGAAVLRGSYGIPRRRATTGARRRPSPSPSRTSWPRRPRPSSPWDHAWLSRRSRCSRRPSG
jgi:N-acetylmuramoyl-L-alanine amidase